MRWFIGSADGSESFDFQFEIINQWNVRVALMEINDLDWKLWVGPEFVFICIYVS